jgi:hypothetical protein
MRFGEDERSRRLIVAPVRHSDVLIERYERSFVATRAIVSMQIAETAAP